MNDPNHEDLNPEEDEKLMYIYEWVDSVNLSRQKKNISRDFCDGVLLAEMIKSVYPQLVDLHNYPSTNSTKQKQQNWTTLNRKILKKIGVNVTQLEIDEIICCKQFAVEQIIARVYNRIYLGSDEHKPIL